MKILIFWEQSSWGGVDSHLLTLLNLWKDNNDSFVIVHNKKNSGLKRIKKMINLNENKIDYISFNSISYNSLSSSLNSKFLKLFFPILYLFKPFLIFLMSIRLFFIFKKIKDVDVLFANNGGYPGANGCISALIAANWLNIKGKVLMIHHAATKFGILLMTFEKVLDRYLSNIIDVIICASNATLKSIENNRFFNEESVRFKVIPNGVLNAVQKNANLFNEENFKEKINLAIIGRLEPYKGHEDLIHAISIIKPDIKSKINLYIIGKTNTSYYKDLKQIVEFYNLSELITFTDYIDCDINNFIYKFDLVISATRSFEGFGLTIAEALNLSVPVIATKVGAVPEIFNDNIIQLVNPNSPIELKSAIESFIINPEIFKSNAKRGRKKIKLISNNMSAEFKNTFKFSII